MKINKHIEGLATEYGLGSYEIELLQFVWNKRNQNELFCVNIANVSASGMTRQMKVVVNHKGKFVNITRLICKITDIKYNRNKETLSIGGSGMDMGFAMLENFYSYLIPKNMKVMPYKLNAVQRYFYL